jgi:hypothetical protein
MNRKILTAALGAIVVFATAVPASAQVTQPVGVSARIGAFFPTNEGARSQSNTWFAGGVEYRLRDMQLGTLDAATMSHLALSVDFMGSGDYRHTPLLVNYVVRSNELFYSVGAGVGFGRIPLVEGTSTRTRFAYQLGVGYDFQRGQTPLFLEAKYFGSSQTELNGIGFYIGVRL